jgi:hypothetical protein
MMSVESQGQLDRSASDNSADGSKDTFETSSGLLDRDAQDSSDSVLRLTTLLKAAPVDLARIGKEIRAHPNLEALILRLAASLVLSAGSAALTIEEAAVALGTDRLRVLVYMWSLISDGHDSAGCLETSESQSTSTAGGPSTRSKVIPAWNAETLYLASFRRWLGLDSPASANVPEEPPCFAAGLQSEDMAGLTDLLMRDFVALIPVLDPVSLQLRQREVPAEASGALERKTA